MPLDQIKLQPRAHTSRAITHSALTSLHYGLTRHTSASLPESLGFTATWPHNIHLPVHPLRPPFCPHSRVSRHSLSGHRDTHTHTHTLSWVTALVFFTSEKSHCPEESLRPLRLNRAWFFSERVKILLRERESESRQAKNWCRSKINLPYVLPAVQPPPVGTPSHRSVASLTRSCS